MIEDDSPLLAVRQSAIKLRRCCIPLCDMQSTGAAVQFRVLVLLPEGALIAKSFFQPHRSALPTATPRHMVVPSPTEFIGRAGFAITEFIGRAGAAT